jgi:hypothetical protein
MPFPLLTMLHIDLVSPRERGRVPYRYRFWTTGDEPWVDRQTFDSHPNLRHGVFRDHPKQGCYRVFWGVGHLQTAGGDIISHPTDRANPQLESMKLQTFALHCKLLSDLIEKR